jgi:nucleotide-binding universal stress UspA family protein
MRDLLVHATRYPDWDAGVTYAARLAAGLHASLTGVVTVPMPDVPMPYYDGGAVIAEYAAFLDEQVTAARAAAPAFTAWTSSLGVAHPSWQAVQGQPAATLRYIGNWHDLLVLGAARGDPWTEPGGIASIVLGCDLPCLVVPQSTPAEELRGARMAVAWNGSVEAIRALHAALPLLQLAGRVVVLMGEARPAPAVMPEFQLEVWCERHGLSVDYRAIEGDADGGAGILASAHAAGARLLVLGAYGRTRVSEWVLGGVTRYMLQHADIPLLLRH